MHIVDNDMTIDNACNAVFLWARELVFTIFSRTKTVPKHSHELEIL